jgi:Rps23 Pro-64 3,4-dihydroxylase Tpa1-like proline 4-hydroxylase
MQCIFCKKEGNLSICNLCYINKKDFVLNYQKKFLTASPYPHIVLNNFFHDEFLQDCLDYMPEASEDSNLNSQYHQIGKHIWSRSDESLGATLEHEKAEQALQQFTSLRMIDIIEKLTGMTMLEADPEDWGGGMQQILPGGNLNIHTDASRNKIEGKKHRRINMIIYLNHDWKEEYGGNLELWNNPPEKCVESISPLFNRTVLFETTAYSWHGHPEPLACPKDRTRKSIAFFFYSEEPGNQQVESTLPQWFVPKRGIIG